MVVNIDANTLIKKYEEHHPESPFFHHDTLKFWGERRSEMRVLKHTRKRGIHECYVLSVMQRTPFGNRRAWHYIDVDTYKIIMDYNEDIA